MRLYLDDIRNHKIRLLYEQAFLHFLLNLKNQLFYFPTPAPKENKGISVPVYRAIIHNSDEEFIENIDRLSYRKEEEVKKFGRVNRPFQVYFYASDNANTCLSELNWKIKMEIEQKKEIAITIGQWTFQRDLNICVIPDWENKTMNSFIEKIDSLKTLSLENINILKGINELILTEDDNSNIHQVTSAFCNVIVYDSIKQDINIDGFLYTSVKDRIGYNLALFPELIDNKNSLLMR